MAVLTSSDKVLQLFAVSDEYLHMVSYSGLKVSMKPGEGLLVQSDESTITIPLKAKYITLAEQGQLGPSTKLAVKYQIEDAINKLAKASKGAAEAAKELGSSFDSLKGLAKALDTDLIAEAFKNDSPDMGVGKKVPKYEATTKPSVSQEGKMSGSYKSWADGGLKSQIPKTSPCPLSQAMNMYQPVTATSQGSVYHLILMTTWFNTAIRHKNNKLSVRVESTYTMPTSVKETIKEFGLSEGNGYYSAHYQADAKDVAKFVGAFAMVFGMQNIKDLGDPAVLVNTGS